MIPNPINGPASIEWEAGGQGPQVVKLYDIAGRVVFSRELPGNGPGRGAVAWADLLGGNRVAAGVYFLRLDADRGAVPPVRVVVME